MGQDSKRKQRESLLTWMSGSRSLDQGPRPTAVGVSCEPEVPEKAKDEVACEPGPGPLGPEATTTTSQGLSEEGAPGGAKGGGSERD